jgi:hypothetical protein
MMTDQLAVPTIPVRLPSFPCYAGAATAHVMKHLTERGGAAPVGVRAAVDRLLIDLCDEVRDVDAIADWFTGTVARDPWLGHRFGGRLVALPTAAVLRWVGAGGGVRGAVLATAGEVLHPRQLFAVPHAVAITWEDGFNFVDAHRTVTTPVLPIGLAEAHRRCQARAFLVYYLGEA